MITETPVNAGHSYATTAEDYEDREEWAKAAEAHAMAASQFQKALEYAQDAMAAKTLRLLTSNHLRKAKDLQRRIPKQQLNSHETEAVNINETSSTADDAAGIHYQQNNRHDGSFDMESLRHALSLDQRHATAADGAATPAIGGSYAVLPQNDEEEEDNDPFNKFFEVVEKLMDNLSNPVAFASAPLNENDNPVPIAASLSPQISTDQDSEEDLADRSAPKMVESYFFVSPESPRGLDHPVSATSLQDDESENEHLRKQIDQLTRRIQELDKAAAESNLLKTSILQFKSDVHKQAKRIMQSHDFSAMRASSSAAMTTAIGDGRPTREHLVRIRELEEENRQLRIQNEKQQALVAKYRERWEKLKESAKKRRAHPDQGMPYSDQGFGTCSYEKTRKPILLRSLAHQSTPSPAYPPVANPPRTSSPLAKESTL